MKFWKFLYKSGEVLFLYCIMFVLAVSLFSLSQKGKVYYGNRCNCDLNKSAISYLKQEEIIAYDYELNCNTLYLDLYAKDNLEKNELISLLMKISSYYKDINNNINTQVKLKNNNYLIFANLINDGSVSLTISEL